MKVKIYGRPNCIWCDKAVDLLNKTSLQHSYEELTAEVHMELEAMLGFSLKTVPIIFIDKEYIGGYKELEKILGTE